MKWSWSCKKKCSQTGPKFQHFDLWPSSIWYNPSCQWSRSYKQASYHKHQGIDIMQSLKKTMQKVYKRLHIHIATKLHTKQNVSKRNELCLFTFVSLSKSNSPCLIRLYASVIFTKQWASMSYTQKGSSRYLNVPDIYLSIKVLLLVGKMTCKIWKKNKKVF